MFARPISDDEKRRGKVAVFEALHADYQVLRTSWGGWPGYDRWFAEKPGNSHLAAVATYTDAVPGFRRMLETQGNELPKFFEAARALASVNKTQRDLQLGVLTP